MFYSIWLLAAALAGWAGGTIAGDDGFGTGADILLGLTGAFVVRWSLENIGISLKDARGEVISTGRICYLLALLRIHTHTSGLSPFPKKANCHVDHNHDYYDLNQKLNRHFAASLTRPIVHQSITAANRQAGG